MQNKRELENPKKERTGPRGFEPLTTGLEGQCYILTKPRAHISDSASGLG